MSGHRLLVAVAILGPFLWFFGDVLFGERMFAYRDSAYYYYPLFEWTSNEWSHGRIPLWNPQDNFGTPVLADGTSSVFYPGKLLFALPLNFATCYKLYVTGHLLLAAVGAYLLARRWKASTLAAGLCAIAYAYGGNVLFQYCNVVFLIGAAWLPFALLAADKMLVERRVTWALVLAVVLSLMVLGGDPQAAYHAGLLAALYAWMLRRDDKRQRNEDSNDNETCHRPWLVRLMRHRVCLLAVAAFAGALLAAVQILPSLELSRRSERAAFVYPRNVYETAKYLQETHEPGAARAKAVREGLLGRPSFGHHEHIYQFSMAPWQFAEMMWPNCSGRSFPINRRWTTAIPGGDRVWTPTMYMGLLPLVLALAAVRLRRGRVQQRFMTWTVFLGCLAALGWYGVGWIVHELRTAMAGADPQDPVLGEPVGGLYWLMVVLLPGYVNFRYPAKLMVVAALGLSLLAARGWDMTFESKSKGIHWMLIAVVILSLIGAAAMIFIHPTIQGEGLWSQWLQHAPPDDVFGPVDKVAAANDLLRGFLHALALTCGLLMLLWWRRRESNRAKLAVPVLALAITVADLMVAQSWTVISAPQQIWETASPLAQQIKEHAAADDPQQFIRVFRQPNVGLTPHDWLTTRSRERHAEWVEWNRTTLFPKHHLDTQLSLLESQTSIVPDDFACVRDYLNEYHISFPQPAANPFLAQFAIYTEGSLRDWVYEAHAKLKLPESIGDSGILLARNPKPQRAWIVPSEHVEWWRPLTAGDATTVGAQTENVLFLTARTRPDGSRPPRDLVSTAIVEAEAVPNLPAHLTQAPAPANVCRVIVDRPQRVELEAELARRGLLVLNDYFYSGWTAEVLPNGDESEAFDAPIVRTNRIMRGVYLPPGKHRVIFRFEPISFRFGALVTAVGWLALGLCTVSCLILRRRRHGQ